jgi:uncharacterized membrane protein YgcG
MTPPPPPQVVENWYPTAEEGENKGVMVVVTAGKEGALSGGKAFMAAVGDELIDSIVSDNIPIFTEEEKYNQTVTSSLDRLAAKLQGKEVPGGRAGLVMTVLAAAGRMAVPVLWAACLCALGVLQPRTVKPCHDDDQPPGPRSSSGCCVLLATCCLGQ